MHQNLLIKIHSKLGELNSDERSLAMEMMANGTYKFRDNGSAVYIETERGERYEFFAYVRSRCNCR